MERAIFITKRLLRGVLSLALVYLGLYCVLLLVPESFFLRAGGVPLSEVDWFYRNNDMSYYLLDCHESTVDWIRFRSATKWLPPNVLVKTDYLRYNLDRQQFEILDGWEDAEQQTDLVGEGGLVSVPMHGLKHGNFVDWTLLLKIAQKEDGMNSYSDYRQRIPLEDGTQVDVSIIQLEESS